MKKLLHRIESAERALPEPTLDLSVLSNAELAVISSLYYRAALADRLDDLPMLFRQECPGLVRKYGKTDIAHLFNTRKCTAREKACVKQDVHEWIKYATDEQLREYRRPLPPTPNPRRMRSVSRGRRTSVLSR